MPLKLSICIVAYNNYGDVLKAVESIERFTDCAIKKRIYIVDNGQSDKKDQDANAIKKINSIYSDVEYIKVGKNLGFGKGHNYVISELDSEYHAIVNPDIILKEDVFQSILNYMDRHRDVGMVVPRITDEHGKLQAVYRKELTVLDMFIRMFCKKLFPKRVEKHTLQYKDYSKPFQVPFAQGSFLVLKTVLMKDLQGFDDNFFMYVEDADLCRRVNLVSKLVYFPGASVIHKWEKGSHSNKKLFKYHIESMKYYFKKWGIKWI